MIITCIIAHTPIQAEMFAREMGWFHSRDCRIITHPDQLRGLNKRIGFSARWLASQPHRPGYQ